VTFFISLLALLLALTLGQDWGFAEPRILSLFAASALFLGLFVMIEWRLRQPMIELRLFRNALFRANLIVRILIFVAFAGLTILLPFYLQDILHYSPQRVGLLLAVVPLCLGLVSPFSGSLSDRFGPGLIASIGLLILLVGYLAVSTLNRETTIGGYILRLIPIGLGTGIFQSPNNSAIMGSVSRERLGVASGLISITRTLGSTAGVALLGALWAGRIIYHTGERLPGGATAAPVAAQMIGLQDTFLVAVGLIGCALGLSLWNLVRTRRLAVAARVEPGG